MDRRVLLVAVLAVGGLLAAAVAGTVAFVWGFEDPGDCGLGTGGVYPVDETGSGATDASVTVRSLSDARAVIEAEYEKPENGTRIHQFGASNASVYVQAELAPDIEASIRSRAEGIAEDDRVYHFEVRESVEESPDGGLAVTERGRVFYYEVGAC